MANFVFNVSKGAAAQYVKNVKNGTPSTSRLLIIPFANTAADATVVDAATVTALEAVTNVTERTANGWNRKTIAAADITSTVDDTNDRYDADITVDPTWTPTVAGDTVNDLCIAYDPDPGTSTDSTRIPLTLHDFAVTPDGTLVTGQIAAAGFYRAS